MNQKLLLKGIVSLFDFKPGGPWWHVPAGVVIGFVLAYCWRAL